MNIEKIIDEVYEFNLNECRCPLTKKKICNTAKYLLNYSFTSEEEFKLALEYAVLIRSEADFSIHHYKNTTFKEQYKYYLSIDFAVRNVLSSMKKIEEENNSYKAIDDNIDYLLKSVNNIESDLKLQLLHNKKLSNAM